VRGSKAVYVSSGTRRELTVDQNLRLNVSGQLTQDIYVRAALTDDNLPVVPEGNTEELKDIDKVLIELTARQWRATLGDFVAVRQGTRYGGYRRKLQGFALDAFPGDLRAEVLFGSPKGRYRTIELRGEEANQGPYFLGGGEAGQNLFIVAGTAAPPGPRGGRSTARAAAAAPTATTPATTSAARSPSPSGG